MKKIIFLILLIVTAAEIYILKYAKTPKSKDFNSIANQIVKTCGKSEYKPGCYEKDVPKLMNRLTLEETFEVTKLIQTKDKSYAYCHVLGHKLSEIETAKNPKNWKKVISRCPSGVCSNGCVHGAFQQKFRSESAKNIDLAEFKKDLKGICEKSDYFNPTGLERGTCYHALGHLMMYITEGEIKNSIGHCDEFAVDSTGQNFSQLCYDGAFMQIYQPLEPEDFALVKGKQPKKIEQSDFCAKFSGNQRWSCWTEGWPLFWDEIKSSPESLDKFCANTASKEEKDRCYLSLMYVITAQFNFDTAKLSSYCQDLSGEYRGNCFAHAASRMIETDWNNIPVSVDFCKKAVDNSAQDICFKELIIYSTYNFHPGSDPSLKLCNLTPDPWKKACLNNNQSI